MFPMESRADLAGEIDLQRRVDGDHVIIACNQGRIVSVCRGVELEDGIVIHEIKQAFRAQGKSQNDFSGLEVLAGSRNHARFDQRNHAIGNKFTMYREILAVH